MEMFIGVRSILDMIGPFLPIAADAPAVIPPIGMGLAATEGGGQFRVSTSPTPSLRPSPASPKKPPVKRWTPPPTTPASPRASDAFDAPQHSNRFPNTIPEQARLLAGLFFMGAWHECLVAPQPVAGENPAESARKSDIHRQIQTIATAMMVPT